MIVLYSAQSAKCCVSGEISAVRLSQRTQYDIYGKGTNYPSYQPRRNTIIRSERHSPNVLV